LTSRGPDEFAGRPAISDCHSHRGAADVVE
jgi:hypothetical protein